MRKGYKYIISFILLIVFEKTSGQYNMQLKLQDAIIIAQKKSPDYLILKNYAEASYWRNNSFLAAYKPGLILSGEMPVLNQAINKITLPDGSETFASQKIFSNSLSLGLSQNISLTGGTLFLGSSLQRLNVFSDPKSVSYFTSPVSINYIQNSVFYNAFKWDRRINPLVFEESKREVYEKMEEIALSVISKYFAALLQKVNLDMAQQNAKYQDTLLLISKERLLLGKVGENEILQVELALLRSKNDIARSSLLYEQAENELRRFLALDKATTLSLDAPADTLFYPVLPEDALKVATQARRKMIEFERRKLEAERDLAQAKGEGRVGINLNFNTGISQHGESLQKAYSDFDNQVYLSVGFRIPIMDWGKVRSNIRMANANLDLVTQTITSEKLAFDQEIAYQAANWKLQRDLYLTALQARKVAVKRLEIAKDRLATGKITLTDLNIAQQEKDYSVVSYYNTLYDYWIACYNIRKMTLYDFNNNVPIKYDQLYVGKNY